MTNIHAVLYIPQTHVVDSIIIWNYSSLEDLGCVVKAEQLRPVDGVQVRCSWVPSLSQILTVSSSSHALCGIYTVYSTRRRLNSLHVLYVTHKAYFTIKANLTYGLASVVKFWTDTV